MAPSLTAHHGVFRRLLGSVRVMPSRSSARKLAPGFTLAEITQLVAGDTTPSATRQWRDMAARKLPELDRHIAQAQVLHQAVADCLECGCMNFDRCLLLAAAEATP